MKLDKLSEAFAIIQKYEPEAELDWTDDGLYLYKTNGFEIVEIPEEVHSELAKLGWIKNDDGVWENNTR